jgi:hypothetical protein
MEEYSMKKVKVAFCIVALLVLVLPSSVFAGLPGTGWKTSYAVMNIGSTAANFTMDAYDKNSSTVYSSSGLSMDQYEALTYDPSIAATYPAGEYVGFTTDLPSGFEGSVVLSSDQPLASAATLTNSTTGTAYSRYQAVSATATTLLFPTVKHNWSGQTTSFYVQAAGTTSSNVTMTYTMNDGSTHTQNTTITAGKMFVFDPANATPAVASSGCGTVATTSPCFGAASAVSTTDPIAGVILEHPHTGSPAAYVLSTRALTSADQAYSIYAPSIKNYYYAATAGFTVMNTGGAEAYVDIALTVTGVEPGTDAATAGVLVGDTYTDSDLIPAGQSIVIGPFDANLGGMPKGTFAAMSVTSTTASGHTLQYLVGTSNEAKTASISGGKAKAVYYGFATAAATDELACPVHTELISGMTGGESVVNVGGANTTVHFVYVMFNGATYHFWTTAELAPGEAIGTNRASSNTGGKFTNDGSWAFSVLSGKKFSVHIYSSNGEELIALAQEASTAFTKDIMNYECVNY